MKSFILTSLVTMFLSFQAYSATGLQCSAVDEDIAEWTIEILGDELAFFDNNSWSTASYLYSIETTNPIDVYTSNDPQDPFTVEVKREEAVTVKIFLPFDDSDMKMFEFNCEETSDLFYF